MVLSVPAGMVATLANLLHQTDPTARLIARDSDSDPGQTLDWSGVAISSNTGANAPTLRAEVIDPSKKILTTTLVEVDIGYGSDLAAGFRGELMDAARSFSSPTDGDAVSISCLGKTVDLLDIEVTTPTWDQNYYGTGNWNQASVQANLGWRRSEIVDDLMRIYLPAVAKSITATVRYVRQKAFVKTKLADAIAQIAVLELAKARFSADGRFVFRPTP